MNKYTKILSYFVEKAIRIQNHVHIMVYRMASCLDQCS